jgi:hypothetical protein
VRESASEITQACERIDSNKGGVEGKDRQVRQEIPKPASC